MATMSFLRSFVRRAVVSVGAVGLTLSCFLVLPLTQAIGKPREGDTLVRAVDTGPNNVEAAVNLIRYLIQLGRIGDAQHRAEEAAARIPQSPEILALRDRLNASRLGP